MTDNLSTAANIAQIVEAIIVAISVVFVWWQLRQQTKLAKAANVQTLLELVSPFSLQVIQDRSVAELWFEGHKKYESYDGIDKERYKVFLLWRLTFQENVFYQNKKGLLDHDIYKAWENDFSFFIKVQLSQNLWNDLKGYFQEEFQNYIEGKIQGRAQQLIQPERE